MEQVLEVYITTSRAEGRSDPPVRAPGMLKPKHTNKQKRKKNKTKPH